MAKKRVVTGDIVVAIEANRVSTQGNRDGKSIPAFNESFDSIVGFIRPGSSLAVLDGETAELYIYVLTQYGPVYVQRRDVKHP